MKINHLSNLYLKYLIDDENSIRLFEYSNKINKKNLDYDLLKRNKIVFNQFLSIFLAQIKNQDPINPMNNNQITSQMLGMNVTLGIEELNDSIRDIKDKYLNLQKLKLSNLIGKEIFTKEKYDNIIKKNFRFGFEITKDTNVLVTTIVDSLGKEYIEKKKNLKSGIYHLDLKKLKNNNNNFKINFYATDKNDNKIDVKLLKISKIKGIYNHESILSEHGEIIPINNILLVK